MIDKEALIHDLVKIAGIDNKYNVINTVNKYINEDKDSSKKISDEKLLTQFEATQVYRTNCTLLKPEFTNENIGYVVNGFIVYDNGSYEKFPFKVIKQEYESDKIILSLISTIPHGSFTWSDKFSSFKWRVVFYINEPATPHIYDARIPLYDDLCGVHTRRTISTGFQYWTSSDSKINNGYQNAFYVDEAGEMHSKEIYRDAGVVLLVKVIL